MPADPDGGLETAGVSGGAPPLIRVRPVQADDGDLLLAWANDPLTRAAGFHRRPIEPAEHRAWLAERLGSAATRLFVGLAGEEPIGQVRLELDEDGSAEVSIAVAPEARGRGVGRLLLEAGLDAVRADPSFAGAVFVARVRPENQASLRLFGGAGFREVERTLVDGQACVVLSRP